MNGTIAKGLELGLAFVLFVSGLSVFFGTGQQMMGYIQAAKEATMTETHYTNVEVLDTTYLASKDEMLFMLLENSWDVISIDGVAIASLAKRIEDEPGVPVHELMEQLKRDVGSVREGYYEELLVVDDSGIIVSTEYVRK